MESGKTPKRKAEIDKILSKSVLNVTSDAKQKPKKAKADSDALRKHQISIELPEDGLSTTGIHLARISNPIIHMYKDDQCKICNIIHIFLSEKMGRNFKVNEIVAENQDVSKLVAHHQLFVEYKGDIYPVEGLNLEKLQKKSKEENPNPELNESLLKTRLTKRFQIPTAIKLLPHQEDLVEKFTKKEDWIDKNKFLLYWSMGSGKTIGVLQLLSLNNTPDFEKVIVICPNSLIDYWKNVISAQPQSSPTKRFQEFLICGFADFGKRVRSDSKFIKNNLIIIDEAHHFRNLTLSMIEEVECIKQAKNIFILTGTPAVNTKKDFIGLLSLFGLSIAEKITPESPKEHNKSKEEEEVEYESDTLKSDESQDENIRTTIIGTSKPFSPMELNDSFSDNETDSEGDSATDYEGESESEGSEMIEEEDEIDNKAPQYQKIDILDEDIDEKLLSKYLKGKVSFYDPKTYNPKNFKEHFPNLIHQTIEVEMTWKQSLEYYLGTQQKIRLGNHMIESSRSNSYETLSKLISNSAKSLSDDAPKLEEAANWVVKHDQYPVVIYSHFLEQGISRIKQLLVNQKPDLTMELLTGSTPTKKRNSIVEKYNKRKIQILFITDAAKEGIDLHNSYAILIIEPHPNLQSESQTVNRVARYDSHKKSENKDVHVIKFISVFPKKSPSMKDAKDINQIFFSKYVHGRGTNEDISKDLRDNLTKIRQTIDQKVEEQNQKKFEEIQKLLNVLRKEGKLNLKIPVEVKKVEKKIKKSQEKEMKEEYEEEDKAETLDLRKTQKEEALVRTTNPVNKSTKNPVNSTIGDPINKSQGLQKSTFNKSTKPTPLNSTVSNINKSQLSKSTLSK